MLYHTIHNKNAKISITHKILCVVTVLLLIIVLCPMASAEAETVDVGIPVEEHPELFLTRSMPTHGEGKIAVFLIDFPDCRNDNPVATAEYYDGVYFKGGVETSWGQTVAKFFKEESFGKLNLSGQVFDWYTAKHERSYYDNRKAELVMEAAEYYCSKGVDFTRFDGDKNGVIDGIVYHFAGEESLIMDDPWYGGLMYGAVVGEFGTIDGLKFTTMVQIANNAGIRRMIETICHELFHTLGMPDLYSKVYPSLRPTDDLMSSSARRINPYSKILLGWIDTIKIISEDTSNMKLNIFDGASPGDVAIITDKYNGIFDEFYILIYRRDSVISTSAIIWHIDARLTEDGTAFLYQNLYYDPRPDKNNGHNTGLTKSEHLFIEEICADPAGDFLLNHVPSVEMKSFGENDVFGADHKPSSDTHDGRYTGIRIENFLEHDDKYLTFNVSFVKDGASPVLVEEEGGLKFEKTIKLHFNEHIYAGDAWQNIIVTDLDGNPLPATVIQPHYPQNEIEITFNTEAYKTGYQITLPDDCVRDSSGNGFKALTIKASKEEEGYIFPVDEKQLPSISPLLRNDGHAHFFPQENSLVVITGCWKNHVLDAVIEFMRLDFEGNVLTHKFIKNPFEKSSIIYVEETGDGCYIFVCRANSLSQKSNLLFGVNQNGDLMWANDSYYDPQYTYNIALTYKYETGMLGALQKQSGGYWILIDSKTGKVEPFTSIYNILSEEEGSKFYQLPDGNLMRINRIPYGKEKEIPLKMEIIDPETCQVLKRKEWSYSENGKAYTVSDLYANDDGTFIVQFGIGGDLVAALLDADLNIIKTVPLQKRSSGGNDLTWIKNDGFCEIIRISQGNHDDDQFHVRRYDKYLNLLWETDVDANFVHYFKNNDGELLSYKSISVPVRECYIEYYGKEKTHTHDLVYVEPINPTCKKEGCLEYWYCEDCGCQFSDQGQTLVSVTSRVLPKVAHTEQIIPAVPPTCTRVGLTEGVSCSVCMEIFQGPESIPALGHNCGEWNNTKSPTCTEGGQQRRDCSRCDHFETREVAAAGHTYEAVVTAPTCTAQGHTTYTCHCGDSYVDSYVNALGHKYGNWTQIKAPTCTEKGSERRDCDHCDHFETREVAAAGHTYEAAVTAPTCAAQGHTTYTCHCGDSYVDSYVNALGHKYGNWTQIKALTCTEKGSERRDCDRCDHFETREVAAAGHTYEAVVTAPTCTGQGYTTHTCHCGESYVDSYVDALGHNYGEWNETEAPTCTKQGEESRNCDGCNCVETRKLQIIDHADRDANGACDTCDKQMSSGQEEPSGCSGVVTISSSAILLLSVLGLGVALKKKED